MITKMCTTNLDRRHQGYSLELRSSFNVVVESSQEWKNSVFFRYWDCYSSRGQTNFLFYLFILVHTYLFIHVVFSIYLCSPCTVFPRKVTHCFSNVFRVAAPSRSAPCSFKSVFQYQSLTMRTQGPDF